MNGECCSNPMSQYKHVYLSFFKIILFFFTWEIAENFPQIFDHVPSTVVYMMYMYVHGMLHVYYTVKVTCSSKPYNVDIIFCFLSWIQIQLLIYFKILIGYKYNSSLPEEFVCIFLF